MMRRKLLVVGVIVSVTLCAAAARAVEVWAQAVEKAGTLETDAVAEALRTQQFDTVLGRIGFDERGDVYGAEPFVWYVWQEDNYVPLEEKPHSD